MNGRKQHHLLMAELGVRFAQLDLDQLREGDWLNLKEELWEFFQDCPFLIKDPTGSKPMRWPSDSSSLKPAKDKEKNSNLKAIEEKTVKEIQKSLQHQLHRLTLPIAYEHVTLKIQSARISLSTKIDGGFETYAVDPSSHFNQFLYTKNPRQAGIIAMGQHLVLSGLTLDQIRHCPKCSRIFLIKRKPRKDRTYFCSLKCSRLAATHRYRAKMRDKVRENDRKRKRAKYLEKQREN